MCKLQVLLHDTIINYSVAIVYTAYLLITVRQFATIWRERETAWAAWPGDAFCASYRPIYNNRTTLAYASNLERHEVVGVLVLNNYPGLFI